MSQVSSFHTKIFKGSLIAIFFTLFGAVFAYLVRIFYSRSLSIDDYGFFYALFGFFILISTYVDLGFGDAMAYFIPKHLKAKQYPNLVNTLIYCQVIQILVAIVVAVILALSASLLSVQYFRIPGSEGLIYLFCIFLILVSIINSLVQAFTGLQKEKYYSSLLIVRSGLIFFISLILFYFGYNDIFYYGIGWIIAYLLTALVFLYLLFNKHTFINFDNLSWDPHIVKQMYTYAAPAFLTTLIYTIISSSDIVLLTIFKGVREVGVYNIILPIASISLVFLAPLNNIVLPLVAHLMEGERNKLAILLSIFFRTIPFIGFYFAIFLVLFPASTVALIFGDKWVGLTQVALSVFAVGSIALLFSNILGTIVLAIGKVRQRLKILVSVVIFNIALNTFMIFNYGILGAVITNSITALIMCIAFSWLIYKVIRFSVPYRVYIILIIFSVILYVGVRFIGVIPRNWFEYIFAGVIYTVIFLMLGYYLKILDFNFLKSLIKRD